MTRPPVDFKRLKEVTLEQAIEMLTELKLTKREGDQLRFACPACKGSDNRALSVNPSKGFRCFEGNKTGTDAVALVAHVRSTSQYEGGKLLQDFFFTDSAPAHKAPSAASTAPDGGGELQALDYLVHEHEVAQMLGLSAATCASLGAGYAPRGTMAGRILLPLRLPDGKLIGYCGIATKGDQEPLLLFPSNLDQACKATSKPEDIRSRLRVVS